jgi:hypothetical protein
VFQPNEIGVHSWVNGNDHGGAGTAPAQPANNPKSPQPPKGPSKPQPAGKKDGSGQK